MKKGAPLILNGDNDKLVTVREPDYKLVFFGIENPNVDFRAKDIEEKNGFTSFTVEFYGASQRVTVPTVGIHNVYDALAAFAVGYEMRMEPRKIAAGLKSFAPSGMRQRIKKSRRNNGYRGLLQRKSGFAKSSSGCVVLV